MNAPVIYQQYTLTELEKLAWSVANSGMFGIKTQEQAMVLMAIAQAEGRPAALAARDYDIIQGRPAKKAEALLRDFLQAGGRVEWHRLSDELADATFSHESGGSVRITWTIERAKNILIDEWQGPKDRRVKVQVPLADRPAWKNYPRAMLRSRCVSEGVRTVCPSATGSMMITEELRDEMPAEKDITPESAPLEPPTTLAMVLAAYEEAEDVPSFQRAREMASKLPEVDKIAAREKDSLTLARLRAAEQKITLGKLFDAMRSRADIDTLDADATLIAQLPPDQQAEAAAEYHRLRDALATSA
jgi:hypothetical protein